MLGRQIAAVILPKSHDRTLHWLNSQPEPKDGALANHHICAPGSDFRNAPSVPLLLMLFTHSTFQLPDLYWDAVSKSNVTSNLESQSRTATSLRRGLTTRCNGWASPTVDRPNRYRDTQ